MTEYIALMHSNHHAATRTYVPGRSLRIGIPVMTLLGVLGGSHVTLIKFPEISTALTFPGGPDTEQ